jgi:hypothetical protein
MTTDAQLAALTIEYGGSAPHHGSGFFALPRTPLDQSADPIVKLTLYLNPHITKSTCFGSGILAW